MQSNLSVLNLFCWVYAVLCSLCSQWYIFMGWQIGHICMFEIQEEHQVRLTWQNSRKIPDSRLHLPTELCLLSSTGKHSHLKHGLSIQRALLHCFGIFMCRIMKIFEFLFNYRVHLRLVVRLLKHFHDSIYIKYVCMYISMLCIWQRLSLLCVCLWEIFE